MINIDHQLSLIFESDDEFFAAVAIVMHRDDVLLGLSTSNDDRKRKWCFPGGGIKRGESPQKAAERECYEETGVKCKSIGQVLTLKSKPGVAFIPCKLSGSKYNFKPNNEFSALGFFDTSELRSLDLYKNTKDLITRSRRYK